MYYKQLFKQVWQMFRENPYVGIVTIFGTGMAIAMIMMYVIGGFRGKSIDISPENNRHRTLYVKWIAVEDKDSDHTVETGFLSLKTIRECFKILKTPEAVIVTSPVQTQLASIPGGQQKRCFVLPTDDIFWRFFDFKIRSGSPYTEADLESGIKKIILGEELARTMFGTTENIIGKQMQLNYHTYTVCAVVEDIQPITSATYGQAWVPYTATDIPPSLGREGITGRYKCQLIAHSSSDFNAIRKEVDESVARYNASLSDYKVNFHRQPDTKLVEEDRFGYNYPDMESSYLNLIVVIIIVLLVPAINLSGFSLSRMRERKEELGVRKAFGGTRWSIFRQILNESMIYSLLGGLMGLIFCYIGLYSLRNMIFTSGSHWGMDIVTEMPVEIVMNPGTFLLVFLLCALMNILSAGIPAWRVANLPVVESLKAD